MFNLKVKFVSTIVVSVCTLVGSAHAMESQAEYPQKNFRPYPYQLQTIAAYPPPISPSVPQATIIPPPPLEGRPYLSPVVAPLPQPIVELKNDHKESRFERFKRRIISFCRCTANACKCVINKIRN